MAKRDVIEKLVGKFCRPESWKIQGNMERIKIFILRNNDIGDLVLTTPLFEALKQLFPNSRVQVGIGDWNRDILIGNPYVDEILPLNAPWHNKVSCKHSPNSPVGFLRSLGYIFFSKEARELGRQECNLGIDILGSLEGTLLMHGTGIQNRMGVRGYSGGYSGCQKWRQFKIDENAGRSTLRYAEMLGMSEIDLPDLRPQLYLTKEELEEGKASWSNQRGRKKVAISTGAGFSEKCWPAENFCELAQKLYARGDVELIFLGSKKDRSNGEELKKAIPELRNIAGSTTLRETLAILAMANFVICNTTMFMHVAAAFEVPTLVLLGPWYDSVQLHHDQWGHNESTILGREISVGRHELTTVQEAFEHCSRILRFAA